MAKKQGRPTDLTTELTGKIRRLVLDGLRYNKIQEVLGIAPHTWDMWVYKDYQDFRKNLNSWKKERFVKKAEKNIDELLDCFDFKVKADITKFTLETLGKDDGYSKRNEFTGKDGEALQLTVKQVNYGGDNNTIQVPTEELPVTAIESSGQRSEESGDNVA